MNVEALLAVDHEDYYEIVDVTYLDAMSVGEEYVVLKASFLAIQQVKEHFQQGDVIKVAKVYEFPEIRPCDLVFESLSGLQLKKKIAINEISARMHQNILGVCVLDMMDYLDCYMKLMAGGIFITDQNREDKYFEIIEKAQSVEMPEELNADATFEEEQQYMLKKQEYDSAQQNLQTLEKYLNAYDKLKDVKFVNDLLNNAKDEVLSSESEESVEKAVDEYKRKLQKCRNLSSDNQISNSSQQA